MIILLGSFVGALAMFLLTAVLLVQHPWVIPMTTVVVMWWIGHRIRRAIDRW
jgi:hypothetical protein